MLKNCRNIMLMKYKDLGSMLSKDAMKNIIGGKYLGGGGGGTVETYSCHLTPSANYVANGCNYDLNPNCVGTLANCLSQMNVFVQADTICISAACCD